MKEKKYIIPKSTTGSRIKEVRTAMGLTQREFSEFIGSSTPTVERWETKDTPITGPMVLLTEMLWRAQNLPEAYIIPKKDFGLRLFYMYEESICTIIDVDERTRSVKIKNYTDNFLFRAFGKNLEPSFEEYESFLESRCFPKERDKIKLELKKLDIPFYDPLLIIEKTGGRMADDRFHIEIER